MELLNCSTLEQSKSANNLIMKILYGISSSVLLFISSTGSSATEHDELPKDLGKDKSKITLIVNNPEGENVFFQWFSLFNPGDVLQYQSSKKQDTLVIFSEVPIQINTVNGQKVPLITHNYFLAGGDSVVIDSRKGQALKVHSLCNNPMRNNELGFFVKYQKDLENFDGFGVERPFKNLDYETRIDKIKEIYKRNMDYLKTYSSQNELAPSFC